MPRLFIAVPLSEEARSAVEGVVDDVRRSLGEADGKGTGPRWVRMDGLHLTLRFLGPAPEQQIPGLVSIVDSLAGRHAPPAITIEGAGAFPNMARPRTLWLGIASGKDELGAMAADLDAGLVAAGWPPEDRPFRSHLTLARTDGRRSGPAAARLLVAAGEELRLRFEADRVVLFESVTGNGPARYVARHAAPFSGPAGSRGARSGQVSGVPSSEPASTVPVKSAPDHRSPGSS